MNHRRPSQQHTWEVILFNQEIRKLATRMRLKRRRRRRTKQIIQLNDQMRGECKCSLGTLVFIVRFVNLLQNCLKKFRYRKIKERIERLVKKNENSKSHLPKRNFNSKRNLIIRKQLSQKKEVVEGIREWWNSIAQDVKEEGKVGYSQSRYFQILWLIYEILLIPQDSWKRIAVLDWKRDSRGRSFVNFDRFRRAIFQLADVWCETLNYREYLRFLMLMLEKIASTSKKKYLSNERFVLSVERIKKNRMKAEIMNVLHFKSESGLNNVKVINQKKLEIKNLKEGEKTVFLESIKEIRNAKDSKNGRWNVRQLLNLKKGLKLCKNNPKMIRKNYLNLYTKSLKDIQKKINEIVKKENDSKPVRNSLIKKDVRKRISINEEQKVIRSIKERIPLRTYHLKKSHIQFKPIFIEDSNRKRHSKINRRNSLCEWEQDDNEEVTEEEHKKFEGDCRQVTTGEVRFGKRASKGMKFGNFVFSKMHVKGYKRKQEKKVVKKERERERERERMRKLRERNEFMKELVIKNRNKFRISGTENSMDSFQRFIGNEKKKRKKRVSDSIPSGTKFNEDLVVNSCTNSPVVVNLSKHDREKELFKSGDSRENIFEEDNGKEEIKLYHVRVRKRKKKMRKRKKRKRRSKKHKRVRMKNEKNYIKKRGMEGLRKKLKKDHDHIKIRLMKTLKDRKVGIERKSNIYDGESYVYTPTIRSLKTKVSSKVKINPRKDKKEEKELLKKAMEIKGRRSKGENYKRKFEAEIVQRKEINGNSQNKNGLKGISQMSFAKSEKNGNNKNCLVPLKIVKNDRSIQLSLMNGERNEFFPMILKLRDNNGEDSRSRRQRTSLVAVNTCLKISKAKDLRKVGPLVKKLFPHNNVKMILKENSVTKEDDNSVIMENNDNPKAVKKKRINKIFIQYNENDKKWTQDKSNLNFRMYFRDKGSNSLLKEPLVRRRDYKRALKELLKIHKVASHQKYSAIGRKELKVKHTRSVPCSRESQKRTYVSCLKRDSAFRGCNLRDRIRMRRIRHGNTYALKLSS